MPAVGTDNILPTQPQAAVLVEGQHADERLAGLFPECEVQLESWTGLKKREKKPKM